MLSAQIGAVYVGVSLYFCRRQKMQTIPVSDTKNRIPRWGILFLLAARDRMIVSHRDSGVPVFGLMAELKQVANGLRILQAIWQIAMLLSEGQYLRKNAFVETAEGKCRGSVVCRRRSAHFWQNPA